MKRWLLMAGVTGAALLGGLLLRAAGPSSGPVSPQAAAPPSASPPASPSAPAPAPVPARDLFRYADEARVMAPERAAVEPPTVEPPPALEPPAPEPVKLIGLVHRGGVWRAALSIHGDVAVLGVGDESGGYLLVELDQSEGVRLRDAQGQEIRLPLPEP